MMKRGMTTEEEGERLAFHRVMFPDPLLLGENIRCQSSSLCPELGDHWVTLQRCSNMNTHTQTLHKISQHKNVTLLWE